jgi:hypothetical protein
MGKVCLRKARRQKFIRERDWASVVHGGYRNVPAVRSLL